jgi:hypothetical protein
MNTQMRRGVILAPALVVALFVAGCGESRLERTDVSRNEAIIDSLPVYPGAAKTHESSAAYPGEIPGDRHPAGYLTTVAYRVPSGTRSASVLRFYVSRLSRRRGWVGSRVGARALAIFVRRRDLSYVHLTTTSLVPGKERGGAVYEITVAYRGDCCHR